MNARPRSLIRECRAFTLLEMVVVMFVMAVIVGLSAYSFSDVSAEEELKRPASELQRMVMDAVRRASLYEQPQTIVFERRGFLLQYRHDEDGQIWQRRVEIPEGMSISLRRWRSKTLTPATGQVLPIAPGGLCEPLDIRFARGASWLEISLDPLSGDVREETMQVAETP